MINILEYPAVLFCFYQSFMITDRGVTVPSLAHVALGVFAAETGRSEEVHAGGSFV